MIQEELYDFNLPYPGRDGKRVRVFVPEHEEGEKLPVIYMTDGQNLFDEQPEMFGCWYTREAVADERRKSGKAAIIVGIHNDGHPAQRANDLTPASIGRQVLPPDMPLSIKEMMNPQGEVFDDFVVHTVMPAVQERFPVKTGRENTAFCGSSSGGLQTFFTVMSHPGLFGAGGVFSPCFMVYRPEDLRSWINAASGEDMPFLYLYSGAGDGLEQEICRSTELAYEMLTECCPAQQIKKVIKPMQPHHESAWAPEFRDFLHIFLSKA